MTSAELSRLAESLVDAVGAAPVAPYAETERHIGERGARGLLDWLEAADDELRVRYDRLYVPRYLRRNALVAAGNAGGDAERRAVAAHARSDDPLLREHAAWALARIERRA